MKKYEASITIFATGLVFLFVAIMSLVLRAINFDFIGLSYWGFWLFIPAFFIIIGGFQQIYTNIQFKKAVRVALLDRGNQGSHKLEDIALEVGIKPKDVLRVLIDLRQRGVVSYRFNSETGEIVLGENVVYAPVDNYIAPPKNLVEPLSTEGKSYCVYCGQLLRQGSLFCENCGSKI
jgi:hypothetical protein